MRKLRNLLMKNFHYLCIISVITLGLITIIGSGGGGGGSDSPAPTPTPTSCVDVSGTWTVTEVESASACGPGSTRQNTYIVAQNECNITVDAGAYGTHSGTVSESQITYTGSYPEDGGTTTINVNLTVSGDSLSGSATWSWSDGVTSCSGTTQISGTKQVAAGCGQGLPLTISNLSFPGTGTAGQSYDGSVEYQGSFEDIANPRMLLKVPFSGGSTITYSPPDPTASNCIIYFKGLLPSDLSGTGPAYFKLVDYSGDADGFFYNWDENGVSNELSQTVTINP